MENKERRKHPRVTTSNIVSYVCMDGNGHAVAEGMGKTVDISQGGALLETTRPIKSEYILLLSIDLEQKVVETRGKVVHSRLIDPSRYLTGIAFEGPKNEVTAVIRNFIIEYHSRKTKKA